MLKPSLPKVQGLRNVHAFRAVFRCYEECVALGKKRYFWEPKNSRQCQLCTLAGTIARQCLFKFSEAGDLRFEVGGRENLTWRDG